MLEAQGVSIAFGAQTILRDVSFSVREHEFVCLVGPSGCGKTTLLRALAGLVPVASGRAVFKGAEVRSPQTELAVVFQDYGRALLPWRTVAGNVALALEARGIPGVWAYSLTFVAVALFLEFGVFANLQRYLFRWRQEARV